MAEILNDDLLIELLTKEGTYDSTVSAPFLRKGQVTFTGKESLVTRIADCFKLELCNHSRRGRRAYPRT